jgi:hypothetical protein
MKQTALVLSAILLLAANAGAQADPNTSLALPPPAAVAPGQSSLFAVAAAPAPTAASGSSTSSSSALGSTSTDQEPPTVYGVFQNFNWQVSGGFTFFRFYVVPKVTENMAGLNLGMVYYPKGLWVGADGEFDGVWGNVLGQTSKFVLGMGGPRFRWAGPAGLEIWGHGLVGGSHFLPQTTFGKQEAFAYEAGGGVDINVHQRRFAYRVEADMVGTRYFNTYQYSPKVAISFVYKF